jgi:hypothetical protein
LYISVSLEILGQTDTPSAAGAKRAEFILNSRELRQMHRLGFIGR